MESQIAGTALARAWNFLLAIAPLTAMLLVGVPPPAVADPPADGAANRDERLSRRSRLWEEARELESDGKLDLAVVAAAKVVSADREASPQSDELLDSMEYLATLHARRNDFAAARQHGGELLQIATQRHGERHWRIAHVRRALANLELRSKLNKTHLRELSLAEQVERSALAAYEEGRYGRAVELETAAMATYKKLFGEQHVAYAIGLNNLGELYRETGDYARAEPAYKRAIELQKLIGGREHPDYATSLNNLALLYHAKGDYARAEPMCKRAAEIRKKCFGEQHADYVASLNNQAMIYSTMGDYAQAEPLHKRAVEIEEKLVGKQHSTYATLLNNLAEFYREMGDYAQADRAISSRSKFARRCWESSIPITPPA